MVSVYCLDFFSTSWRKQLSKLFQWHRLIRNKMFPGSQLLPIAAWGPPKPGGSVVGWGKCECGWKRETQPLQQRTIEVISPKILRIAASLSLQRPVLGYLRELCTASQDCLWVGKSQASQSQEPQGCPSSGLPVSWSTLPRRQKILAQAQHDANTATLLLEHGQGSLRGWVELMKSCLYTHPQDQP